MENKEEYAGYLIGGNVCEEAESFLKDGNFASPIGDTMVTALSNALGVPMFIFSSIPDHSVISMLPRQVHVSVPIYLAFTHCGPGHYDGIVIGNDKFGIQGNGSSVDVTDQLESQSKPDFCNCGKNDKRGKHIAAQ